MSKWSVRTRNTKSGTYAIYQGRAYPRLAAKAPADKTITTDYSSNESIYNDPVIALNDQDLDDIDGADGAPICYEHNKEDVVGFVRHSWVDRADGERALDIIASIPIKDAKGNPIHRGEKVVQEIIDGKLKGFSVNYTSRIRQNELRCKDFHEISLVNEPFFGGCNLNAGVMAAAGDAPHLEGLGNKRTFLHIFPHNFFFLSHRIHLCAICFGNVCRIRRRFSTRTHPYSGASDWCERHASERSEPRGRGPVAADGFAQGRKSSEKRGECATAGALGAVRGARGQDGGAVQGQAAAQVGPVHQGD
jgi:hypothetical protein